MFPSIFKASNANFCCSLLLFLSASTIRSINASSLSYALSINDSTVGTSATAVVLLFFLAAFFTSFRLFGVFFGVLFGVLVHFPCFLLFLKNKDFAMTHLNLSQKCLLHQMGQVDHRIGEVSSFEQTQQLRKLHHPKFIYRRCPDQLVGKSGLRSRTTLQRVSRIDGFSITENFVHILIMFRHMLKVAFCFVVTLDISPFSISSGS